MKDKSWGQKKFLNGVKFHSVAAISYRFNVERDSYSGKHCYAWGDMSISDCSRTITLDLGMDNQEEYENSLAKINALLETVKQAKKDIIAAKKRKDSVQKRLEKNKKKEKKKKKSV